jgi:hypothetical protein
MKVTIAEPYIANKQSMMAMEIDRRISIDANQALERNRSTLECWDRTVLWRRKSKMLRV